MICSLMFGKMELPMNCISSLLSWSTYTCKRQILTPESEMIRKITTRGPIKGLLVVAGRDPHLSKPVEEGLGQAFATASLCEGVLAAKDLGFLMPDLETYAQFRDVDFCSVIEAGVQTLQHRLRGQVQLRSTETQMSSPDLDLYAGSTFRILVNI